MVTLESGCTASSFHLVLSLWTFATYLCTLNMTFGCLEELLPYLHFSLSLSPHSFFIAAGLDSNRWSAPSLDVIVSDQISKLGQQDFSNILNLHFKSELHENSIQLVFQATIFIGFLQSGCQLIFQTTLLIRFWDNFNGVLIDYGSLRSPQCRITYDY